MFLRIASSHLADVFVQMYEATWDQDNSKTHESLHSVFIY